MSHRCDNGGCCYTRHLLYLNILGQKIHCFCTIHLYHKVTLLSGLRFPLNTKVGPSVVNPQPEVL